MRLLVHIIAIIIPTVRREVDLPRHKMTMRCSGTGGKVTRHGELAAPCRRCGCTVNETISSHVGARHQIRCVVLDPCSVAQILCKRIPITGVKKKKKKTKPKFITNPSSSSSSPFERKKRIRLIG